MSRSYRTEPTFFQAHARVPKRRDGRHVLPDIVEHQPRPGDIFLVDRRMLLKLLPHLPLEYLHGLDYIELRARESPYVGSPFAYYDAKYKLIRMFSTPPIEWPWEGTALASNSALHKFGASLTEREGSRFLTWPNTRLAARYVLAWVLAHEL